MNIIAKFFRSLKYRYNIHISQCKGAEISYWQKTFRKVSFEKYTERYKDILSFFPEEFINTPADKVADIGCGPLGGIFTVKRWKKMHAVDPLWGEYETNLNIPISNQIIKINGYAEDLSDSDYDMIWAINSLDHSGNLETSIKHLISCLRKGGILFLHIHMRTKNELNKSHKMVVQENEIKSFCDWAWFKVLPVCPFEEKDPYRTWVGVYRKFKY